MGNFDKNLNLGKCVLPPLPIFLIFLALNQVDVMMCLYHVWQIIILQMLCNYYFSLALHVSVDLLWY